MTAQTAHPSTTITRSTPLLELADLDPETPGLWITEAAVPQSIGRLKVESLLRDEWPDFEYARVDRAEQQETVHVFRDGDRWCVLFERLIGSEVMYPVYVAPLWGRICVFVSMWDAHGRNGGWRLTP